MMKIALTAILTLAATAVAAPIASSQAIEYVQRPERTDGLYPRVLRGGDENSELLGKPKSEPNGYTHGKVMHVRPSAETKPGIRIFKSGKVSTVSRDRARRPIKPVVVPRENRAAIVPVQTQKHRKGTVIVHKPGAFRSVPDQGKSD